MLAARTLHKQLLKPLCLLCQINASKAIVCDLCLQELPWFDKQVIPQHFEHIALYPAFTYHYPIDRMIQLFKHHQRFDFTELFSQCMATLPTPSTHSKHTVIAAVPLSQKRLATRGFNQSQLLAKQLAKHWDLPLWDGLERSKHTLRQQSLDRHERLSNIRSAFGITHKHVPKHVVLIDDVCTTGATLQAVAQLLKKHGCQSVCAYVIAYNAPAPHIKKHDEGGFIYPSDV